ncbi:polysaccharide deacetylase [Candidatus Magnetoovum chiemensis]|nr:polysaccharide deacetylase [Candidatus Magnetoovum chiemensis]
MHPHDNNSDLCLFFVLDRFRLSSENISQAIKRMDLEPLKINLTIRKKTYLYYQSLKVLQFFLAHISSNNRYEFINFLKSNLKSIKNLLNSKSSDEPIYLRNIIESWGCAVENYWNGYNAVICMTHDVDYLSGYKYLSELAEIDKKYELKSTFNILTQWDYKIDKKTLSSLEQEGFEIGLHGRAHDIALGFRKYDKIKKDISTALDHLSYCTIDGFRAPALSVSENLLKVLSESCFIYDSSILGTCRHTYEILYCYPYKYPNINIWEIPLSIQDTYFFRDQNLTDDEAFKKTVLIINRIIEFGGIVVINCHPCIIKDHKVYYRLLLQYVSELKQIWKPSINELVKYLNKEGGNSV